MRVPTHGAIAPSSAVGWLMACRPFLAPWEAGFLRSLDAERKHLAPRELRKLQQLRDRIENRCGEETPR